VGKIWERTQNLETSLKSHRINGPGVFVRAHKNPKIVSSILTAATILRFTGWAQALGLFVFQLTANRGVETQQMEKSKPTALIKQGCGTKVSPHQLIFEPPAMASEL
jgi:hypothetical protein